MKLLMNTIAAAALIGQLLIPTVSAEQGHYLETDLVVNKSPLLDANGFTHVGRFVDPHLLNPWGIAESATSPFWIADGSAGVSTLYNSAGMPQSLIVSTPAPGDPLGTGGIPSGAVFNTASALGAFKVTGVNSAGQPASAPAVFLFATKNGTIVGWNPGVNPPGFDPAKAGKYAITVANTAGAVYTSLALITVGGAPRLIAANFSGGTVDVFDSTFQPVLAPNAFLDPDLPRGYSPFNVAPITVQGTTKLFVTYAVFPVDKHAKLAAQGHGIVNTFDLSGGSLQHFAQHGQLNAPWAVVLVPAGFGELGGTLWIGNFGDGRINAFDPVTGRFVSKVRGANGDSIAIDGLWTLKFGNGGNGGSATTMYFTAGPNGELDGIFGSIEPASDSKY